MRIGIDARELTGKRTGVGRYLAGLIREWSSTSSGHGYTFVLYAHRHVAIDSSLDVRLIPGDGGTLWEQWTLPRAVAAESVDVLFSPAYSTPIVSAIPRVVTLHDVSFSARPDWFAWREGLRRRQLARRSADVAKAVITVSEFSKSEIAKWYGTSLDKIHVIPSGIERPIARLDVVSPSESTDLLYVGSIFNRRHVPELLHAFARVAERHADVHLHVVGDNRSHPHQDIDRLVASNPASSRIHWHRYVSDDELRALYQRARAFAFLSEYEGHGLTPLEALASGVPSLLLDTAVAQETCGSAALYVSLDVDRIAAGLERLLYDESTRRALLDAAPATLARYSWPKAARETLQVLEAAV